MKPMDFDWVAEDRMLTSQKAQWHGGRRPERRHIWVQNICDRCVRPFHARLTFTNTSICHGTGRYTLSPDASVQMTIGLAWYRIRGEFTIACETFQNPGQAEVLRTFSPMTL
jgi:hypothetical protein